MVYRTEKQQLLLENLICNPDLFALCCNIIDPEYFDPELRQSVAFLLSYNEDFGGVPSIDIVNAECGVDLKQRDHITSDAFEYTSKQVERFCRERAVYKEFVDGAEKINDQDGFSEVIDKLSAALQISLIQDLGTDVLEDVEERIKRRLDDQPYLSTGWTNVDEQMGGGIRKSEFLLISANSGGGKSVALSNLAVSMVKQSQNVLYISLELPEPMICERFETMITTWDKDTKLKKAHETAIIVESVKEKYNATIYVKYMEPDSTCCNDIKAYLKQFETQYGFLPDVLIVDYLDILGTNDKGSFSNEYQKDKVSSTQLKAIGSNPKHPMVLASASQQNRSAIDEQDVTQGNIAGGLSKVNIVDVYISIIMTDAMRLEGLAYFKFLKTRSSSGVGNKVPLNWDPKTLLFSSINDSCMSKRTPVVTEEPFKIDGINMPEGLEGLLEN